MPRINVLPKHIADLIAAGEVVERPSSVIKEFVENSIDAGSKKITVEIQNGGKTYIRVTDDGCGIERDDIKNAFVSHATSKISSAGDLDAISTLGFRGEALASICSVSRVDVMTATSDSEVGTRYIIEGGEEKFLDDVGSPVGTTIVVKDLFYNVPARLKFLKKDVQEGNYVASVLERIALSNPSVSFKFIRDGKISFQTPGDGDLKSAIYAVFGKEFTSQLLPVESSCNGVSVYGFVSKPTAGRGSRSMQTYFVNKRYVKSVLFLSALEAAYKNSIMVGKYPACVLFVDMPAEAVDVNVHPAKTEVRFYDEKRVFEAVYNAVISALNADKIRPQVSFNEAKIYSQPATKGEQLKFYDITPAKTESERSFIIKEFGEPVSGVDNVLKSPEKGEEKQLDFLNDKYNEPVVKIVSEPSLFNFKKFEISTDVNDAPVKEFPEKEIPEKVQLQNTENNAVEKRFVLIDENRSECNVDETKACESVTLTEIKTPEYRFIGEAFNTYLIAELDDKIVLIDKHAAHERILFEKLKANNIPESQIMLIPVTVNLSADEYTAVIENSDLLNSAGYDIQDFGDRCVKVSACPLVLVDENIVDIVTEIAGYLANNIKTLMPEKLDWIYHSMACRAAVKAGNFTSAYEAEKFAGVVLSDDNLRFCPHGRPVLVELTRRELEKQFKRIV